MLQPVSTRVHETAAAAAAAASNATPPAALNTTTTPVATADSLAASAPTEKKSDEVSLRIAAYVKRPERDQARALMEASFTIDMTKTDFPQYQGCFKWENGALVHDYTKKGDTDLAASSVLHPYAGAASAKALELGLAEVQTRRAHFEALDAEVKALETQLDALEKKYQVGLLELKQAWSHHVEQEAWLAWFFTPVTFILSGLKNIGSAIWNVLFNFGQSDSIKE